MGGLRPGRPAFPAPTARPRGLIAACEPPLPKPGVRLTRAPEPCPPWLAPDLGEGRVPEAELEGGAQAGGDIPCLTPPCLPVAPRPGEGVSQDASCTVGKPLGGWMDRRTSRRDRAPGRSPPPERGSCSGWTPS